MHVIYKYNHVDINANISYEITSVKNYRSWTHAATIGVVFISQHLTKYFRLTRVSM